MDAKNRIQWLSAQIHTHDHAYWVLDEPTISDESYDQLRQELESLEQKHPELQLINSPTKRVPSGVAQGFKTVAHSFAMLSLEKAHSPEALAHFMQRCEQNLSSSDIQWVCERKLDGLAVSLRYERGCFISGATRGNGLEGEDISANLRTIKSIPLQLKGNDFPELMFVRGEVLMHTQDFTKLNQRLQQAGQKTFANPRNAAAGSLRQHDSKVTASRPLRFYTYSITASTGLAATHSQRLHQAAMWGLPVGADAQCCSNRASVDNYITQVQSHRDDLDYAIDGVVVKINTIAQQKQLGETAKSPRWAIAYKLPAEQVQTKVVAITAQVGRTGIVTPVATVQPVGVGGVIVQHISLHNYQELTRKDVRMGDTVLIRRAGDVIPELVEVLPAHRDPRAEKVSHPTKCPCCDSSLYQLDQQVAWRCRNKINCSAQVIGAIEHYASRQALNIDGLGSRVIQALYQQKIIKNSADLYRIQVHDIATMPRFGAKSASNLVNSIQSSKHCELSAWIHGLGIKEVGLQTAKSLSRHLHSWQNIQQAQVHDLEQIDDIGPTVAQSIFDFCQDKQNQAMIEQMFTHGLTFKPVTQLQQHCQGHVYVITGTFSMPREEIAAILAARGAKISSSVSKKTTALLCGKNPGSKLTKAESLSIPVWDEEQVLAHLAELGDAKTTE